MQLKEKIQLLEEKQQLEETLKFNADTQSYERIEGAETVTYCQVCWDVDSPESCGWNTIA